MTEMIAKAAGVDTVKNGVHLSDVVSAGGDVISAVHGMVCLLILSSL